ncbi:alpha-L-fucosidase [Edaphobacter albus]|uniref:alpha-L-fucosidase n=1 Tax=Edaphobacter sp. 4G125 TaxID=2763071 RepID=UPI0016463CD1|nr:alpha-L-fucosidase [Edaphobacter sp. 4G125]QNI37987.1 alpha-L-fucosidase [Edaphobacter sp. 4G125]
MKLFLVGLLALCSTSLAQEHVQDKPFPRSEPRPSASTVQQWQDRKFGMFIHFGLYSQLGGMWKDKKIDNGYSEQIMANAPVPLDEYAATARSFNPGKWNPDAIVALAKAAGMRYIVITSKHHDGFNMFHTAQTKYNVVDATAYHRDIVKELADACKRGGIGFGVYYSSIDWHQPGMDHYIEGNSNPLSEVHAQFNVAQLRELLSNYGPITEIWFDMGKPTPEQSKLFATTVHNLQPQTMVSGRVWNYQGDFTVMGDNEVPAYGIDEPWQTPASIFPETWGYRSWQKRDNLQGKIHENITRLVQVVSRGGNYILNIGPEGDGSVVPYEADVLHGIGAWLKPNAEAIYGTAASPFANLEFGYATVKGNAVYLFAKSLPADGMLRLPHASHTQWQSAKMLVSGKPLVMHTGSDELFVKVPADVATGYMPVIKLQFRGPLHIDEVLPPVGPLTLDPSTAEKFYNYNGEGYEAPKTLYKYRWGVSAGCAALIFHVDGEGSITLISNGHARLIPVQEGTRVETTIGADHTLELTPPEPFEKGTSLPVKIRSIEFTPEACKR